MKEVMNIGLLGQVLDIRAAQHRVIVANIANEDTPGFRAHELRFSDALAAARNPSPVTVQATHQSHISPASTSLENLIHPVASDNLPLDANSVNIDLELAKLSNNAMQYNTAAVLIAKEYKELLEAIRGGQ